ncbi:uncharacterized protein Tco025E_05747 [Trypanosoma conorhini]|uniref:Uncharacterized protein n=1 Tax=Trypanosoma conorhini TaxID=83891 RepID=A0A422PB51_9TRYP|nr:uncharacterized protein Tco025E_05747 [Trypanosoma conorhini]RNF14955.1 hypothetical protein Tco025E_05747 [Trypanosoma conorhini]
MLRPRFTAACDCGKRARPAGGIIVRRLVPAAANGKTRAGGLCRLMAFAPVARKSVAFAPILLTAARGFGHLVREVDARGFKGDIHALRHKNAASTQRHVADVLASEENIIFCGAHHTGKMTILRACWGGV